MTGSPLLLLALLGGCALRDAPLQPLAALPYAPPRALAVQTEQELWGRLTGALAAVGAPQALGIPLGLDERVRVPVALDGVVLSRHVLHGDAALEDLLAAYAEALGGLEPALGAWSPEDRREAGLAASAALLGRGLAQALSYTLDSAGREDPWVEQTRAIALEQALLARLVERGQLPPGWPARWADLQRALLAAAPAGLEPPAHPEARAALVREGWTRPESYFVAPEGPGPGFGPGTAAGPDPAALAAHLALLAHALEAPPRPLEEVLGWFEPDPQATLGRVLAVAGAPELLELGLELGAPFPDGVLLSADGGRWTGAAHLDEAQQSLRVRWDRELELPTERRAGVLELLNEANTRLIGPGVYLQEQAVIYYGPAQGAPTPDDALLVLLESITEARRWLEPIARYAEGELPLEEARAALGTLPEEGP